MRRARRSTRCPGCARCAKSVKARGEAILRCVATALAHDPTEIAVPDAHAELPPSASATVDFLRVLLKAVSAELNVAPKLLASAEDLEKLAQHDHADIPALRGWRRQFFGEKALALRAGTLALRDQEQGSPAVSAKGSPGAKTIRLRSTLISSEVPSGR